MPAAVADATRSVFGERVMLGKGSASGDVYTSQLIDLGATHGAVYALPVLPDVPTSAAVSFAGSTVFVADKSTVELAAGTYSQVIVGEKASVRLTGGLYETTELVIGSKSRVEVVSPTEIHVGSRLQTGEKVELGPSAETELDASAVHLAVLGTDSAGAAAELGAKSSVRAFVRVPSGTLHVGEKSVVTGALVAQVIAIDSGVQVLSEGDIGTWPLIVTDAAVLGCVSAECIPENQCRGALDKLCGLGSPACVYFDRKDGTACGDGNACTLADACQSGACVPGAPATDDNPCTECEPTTGTHVPLPGGTTCDDQVPCTVGDACDGAGLCAGQPMVVTDDNVCTVDSCDPTTGQIAHTPLPNGSDCGDGNPCNGKELCLSGYCAQFPPPPSSPCSTCDPVTGGQVPLPSGTACDDQNLCTLNDKCDGGGECKGQDKPVADDNFCTLDSCNPQTGQVSHTPAADGTTCSDGNVCNGVEECQAGTCTPKDIPQIDDGNPCTTDFCDVVTGVTHVAKTDGASCSNGDACDGAETCHGGECKAGAPPTFTAPASPCDFPFCDPATGLVTTAKCAPLDRSRVTPVAASMRFLYQGYPAGTPPIQTGVDQSKLEAPRLAVIRGSARTRAGSPLPNVNIAVLGHPELGTTRTTTQGKFDLLVNGGGALTITYTKEGFLSVQRAVKVPWQDFVFAPDVVMISQDPLMKNALTSQPAQLALGSQSWQALAGPVVTDQDGSRRAVLIAPPGVQATIDGKPWMAPLSVRATEYSVGPEGPNTMPAELPPNSGYTFAFELAADEALGNNVQFTGAPLAFYVESFISGFTPGITVPLGWYDRDNGLWKAEKSGLVVRIASEANGVAEIDTGGVPLTIDVNERKLLAQLYDPPQVLWRVPLEHFSPWDCNWPFKPPDDSDPPPDPDPDDDDDDTPPDDDCKTMRSIVECQGQVLGEEVKVAGTPFALHYRSDRAPGRSAARILEVPLSGPTVPASLKRIEAVATVAGVRYTKTLDPSAGDTLTNQKFTVAWDGRNALGQLVQGTQPAHVDVGYVYNGVYQQTSVFGQNGSGTPITGSLTRRELTLHSLWDGGLGSWDARPIGLGGWTVTPHHVYDPVGQALYFGDGGRLRSTLVTEIRTPSWVVFPIASGRAVAVDPKGNAYVAEAALVRRFTRAGKVEIVAGTGQAGTPSEGASAASANVGADLRGIAVAADGVVYIADRSNGRVWVVRNGVINTLAGVAASTTSTGADGTLATQAQLGGVEKIALGPDRNLYITELSGNLVRRVGVDGKIARVAGDGSAGGPLYSGVPATSVSIREPRAVAIDSRGTVYVAHTGPAGSYSFVRAVTADGLIRTVAGTYLLEDPPVMNGVPATEVMLPVVNGLAIGPDDSLYLSQYGIGGGLDRRLVRRIDADGMINTVAGIPENQPQNMGDGPATGVYLGVPQDVVVGPDRLIYVLDYVYQGTNVAYTRLRTVGLPLAPSDFESSVKIASTDARDVYVFDALGRHLRTEDARTGAARAQFDYTSDGLLSKITTAGDNVTQIEHDSTTRAPTEIVGPFDHKTVLTVDWGGYLNSVSDPLNDAVGMTYYPTDSTLDATGLLHTFTDARSKTWTFSYDSLGRLASDGDPAGGSLNLVRAELVSGSEVTSTTALGLVTKYRTERLTSGAGQRTTFFPAGTSAKVLRAFDGVDTVTAADGTLYASTQTADPIFGLAAPIVSRKTTTPGGLVRSEQRTRTATPFPQTWTSIIDKLDVNGRVATSTFDKTLLTTIVKSPAGRVTKMQHDSQMRVIGRDVSGIAPITLHYDARGRLDTVAQGSRTRSTAFFDSTAGMQFGYVKSVTNAANQQTSFNPDALGRVLDQTEPTGAKTSLGWDGNSNLTSVTPPGQPSHGQTFTPVNLLDTYTPPAVADLPSVPGLPLGATRRSYDLDRRLTTTLRPDGLTSKRVYDSTKGFLTDLQTPSGNVKYEYFLPTEATPGRLKRITDPGGVVLDFGYDGLLLKSQSWSGPVNGSVSFAYDPSFRVLSETATAGAANSVAYFGYDPDDLVICASSASTCGSPGTEALQLTFSSANGLLVSSKLGVADVNDSWTHNTYGEPATYLAKAGTTVVFSETMDTASNPRDALGRIADRVETNGGTSVAWHYTYDSRGRLTDVTKDGALYEHYEYDLNGNRKLDGNGTYDAQDRLLTYGTLSYTYTANGELASKSTAGTAATPTTYSYDVRGNLIQVVLPSGDVIDYLVDGQNRRVGRKKNGLLDKQWLYRNQLNIAAELDGAGALVSRFVYASRTNVPDFMLRGGTTYRIVSDHLGSPRAIVDVATGTVAWRADYGPWGERTVLAGAADFLPMGFAGGLLDAETGLVRFGARDYEPTVGRWLARDPYRFQDGSTNAYAYVNSDPVNFIDPLGSAAQALAVPIAETLLGVAALAAAVYWYLNEKKDYCSEKYRQCLEKTGKPVDEPPTPSSSSSASACEGPQTIDSKRFIEVSPGDLRECRLCLLWCSNSFFNEWPWWCPS